jgi:hypothetical protein
MRTCFLPSIVALISSELGNFTFNQSQESGVACPRNQAFPVPERNSPPLAGCQYRITRSRAPRRATKKVRWHCGR